MGPGPENGLQHGVSGRNTPRVGVAESYCLEWAEALARRGLGCLGIDAPDHGSRGTFTSFFSVDDLPALRDRFRVMTFDLLQVDVVDAGRLLPALTGPLRKLFDALEGVSAVAGGGGGDDDE